MIYGVFVLQKRDLHGPHCSFCLINRMSRRSNNIESHQQAVLLQQNKKYTRMIIIIGIANRRDQ